MPECAAEEAEKRAHPMIKETVEGLLEGKQRVMAENKLLENKNILLKESNGVLREKARMPRIWVNQAHLEL
jgi:hypothetical protein